MSYVARLVAIVWTLTGVIIIGLLVGAIAVSLSNEVVKNDYKLYGAKVNFLPLGLGLTLVTHAHNTSSCHAVAAIKNQSNPLTI